MAKVILILLDGLSLQAAERFLCFPQVLRQAGKAQRFILASQIPPISRPAYASLLTGKSPLEHGILTNQDNRKLTIPTLFDWAIKRGHSTAAAAYYWFFELCHPSPWCPSRHRFFHDLAYPIQHGIFYSHDDYPDAELFADASALKSQFQPDLLLVHPMGIDYAGHSGSETAYENACAATDDLLAQWLPGWLEDSSILITSDHGMNAKGMHHSMEESVLEVPLWLLGDGWTIPEMTSHLDIFSLVIAALAKECQNGCSLKPDC